MPDCADRQGRAKIGFLCLAYLASIRICIASYFEISDCGPSRGHAGGSYIQWPHNRFTANGAHRPFSDLVGQSSIVDTLKNELESGKLSHAYLFTGPRGTGKTSTARLLAKTLNCTNRKNGEPCNECEQCKEITAGNSFNVIEIDAASNRGIDSIRELREKVMVRPAQGKYKIYILDEAHMLTTEAFNALLKTLEEPPEHAIFVMATTDVHKMLPTVLSRCQQFNFQTHHHACRLWLTSVFVAEQEQVNLERGAAELIARACRRRNA